MSKLNKIKSVILSGALAATSVAGSFAATAPSLSANAANDNYAKLLQYSLYFYDTNMCGDVSGKTAISWRGNCHMGDEVIGGFHDAGDHAMFGLPQGYSAATLGWSYYEFKDAYEATGQGEHLKVITDYFCDFFKRSTKLSGDTVTNFLYQKGDGDADHQYWGAPEKQEQEKGKRRMYWTSNSASDIAAEYAAALAANYVNFHNEEDLKYAKALYDFSVKNNSIATDGPMGFYYYEPNCRDEQAWAAGWLYLATNDNRYKNECASKQADVGWVHSWNTVDLGAACIYAEITGNWSNVNGYLGGNCNGSSYLCMDGWGSARYNCAMQMAALVSQKHSGANYLSWCTGQMDYILGNNPRNVCFVTGYASNSSKNTHHRAASGYQGYDGEYGFHEGVKTYHPTAGKTLIGALAGGPADAGGTYEDVIDNYQTNEVAIDYNAGLVGAAAGLYSFKKSGTIDTSIVGVTKIYNSSTPVTPPTTTAPPDVPTTTAYNPVTPPTTTATTPVSGGSGMYSAKVNKSIDYSKLPENDKMIGWQWADLGVPKGEQPTKVVFHISANGNIGTYVGAYGSSTTVQPEYWTQSEQFTESINGNSGTLTWNIDDATSKIIQTQYKGELKLGVWWVDCQQFTVDSIDVYTTGSAAPVVTNPPVTQPPVTQPPVTQPPATNTSYGDANEDGVVDIADATLVLQNIGNPDKYKLSEQGRKNADVVDPKDGNGISASDSLAIQMVDAKVITISQLPLTESEFNRLS